VDRHSLRRSYKDIQKAVDVLKGKRSLIIFPEGTRQTEDAIGPFKPGYLKLARDAGVDVAPVVMSGSGRVIRKRSLLIDPRESVRVSLGAPIPVGTMTADRAAEVVRIHFVRTHESIRIKSV
jgi:1-acyl-sn-glycerol-3-phosphate acyltransferase